MRLWDLRSNKSVRRIATFGRAPVCSVIFAGSSSLICAAACSLYSIDLRRPEVLLNEAAQCVTDSGDEINHISISADGRRLAAGDDNGAVHLYDIESGVLQHAAEMEVHVDPAHAKVAHMTIATGA